MKNISIKIKQIWQSIRFTPTFLYKDCAFFKLCNIIEEIHLPFFVFCREDKIGMREKASGSDRYEKLNPEVFGRDGDEKLKNESGQ